MINKIEIWARAHTNFDTIKKSYEYADKEKFSQDVDWMYYLSNETPNGVLLKKNILYDTAKSKKVYLAHITKSFKSVCHSGRLLSSSGCLVGSVYCTPVIREGRDFRLHNLGSYILKKEAPKFSEDKKDIALLLIELEVPGSMTGSPTGIDYLKLGSAHFSVFSELNYLLSHRELKTLEVAAVTSIRKASSLLVVLDSFSHESIAKNFDKFYKLYQKATENLPILGYFLFETLCELIALFQKGEEVDRYKELNELYCANFKNLIFSACPDLTKSFNPGLFHPDFNYVRKYLKEIKIINESNEDFITTLFIRRLQYLINSRFYDRDNQFRSRKDFWDKIEWNFLYLQNQLSPLLGHTIHRLLRNMKRYPNFFFYFDQYKALQVWNYWNHSNISFPYNAVLPKGEIGINPANPYLKYKIFEGETFDKGGYTYINPRKKLPLIIEPRLAELNMLLMRKKQFND